MTWFKYVVVAVFAVDALTSLLAWRGKKLREPSPMGQLMAGVCYVVMAVAVLVLIK